MIGQLLHVAAHVNLDTSMVSVPGPVRHWTALAGISVRELLDSYALVERWLRWILDGDMSAPVAPVMHSGSRQW